MAATETPLSIGLRKPNQIMNEDRNEGMKDKEMTEMDASGVSMEVVESGESTTQEEENAGMEEKIVEITEFVRA